MCLFVLGRDGFLDCLLLGFALPLNSHHHLIEVSPEDPHGQISTFLSVIQRDSVRIDNAAKTRHKLLDRGQATVNVGYRNSKWQMAVALHFASGIQCHGYGRHVYSVLDIVDLALQAFNL